MIEVIQSLEDVVDEVCLGINGAASACQAAIQQQLPAVRVYSIEWQGYGKTKNELALLASNTWILSVDSDELANDDLRQYLSNNPKLEPDTVYRVRRINYLGSDKIRFGTWGRSDRKITRLYEKDKARWSEDQVHESLVINTMKTRQIPGALHHLTAGSLEQVMYKNKKYALYFSEQMRHLEKQYPIWKKYTSAFFAFIKSYIWRLGFLDGRVGWQLAMAIAKYSYWKYDWVRHPPGPFHSS
ncbi:MAG: glycosyltransferase family 2 protein [Taibaiella sp.]|nr:glycosyltransferase family 2 protein [Taibaiella sp.]MBX9449356.1 glycosyltransferase family 2 protein [Taibaiella sp.]